MQLVMSCLDQVYFENVQYVMTLFCSQNIIGGLVAMSSLMATNPLN